jgi:hypothetical protein
MSSPYLHWLQVRKGDPQLIAEFRKENENASYAFDDEGMCDSDCSWWDAVDDLVEFSKKHPEEVFTMEIRLDGSVDDWEKFYVMNGKVQAVSPNITWPAFRYAKLKPHPAKMNSK